MFVILHSVSQDTEVDKGCVEGGPPLVADISTPLLDGLDTPLLFSPWANFSTW